MEAQLFQAKMTEIDPRPIVLPAAFVGRSYLADVARAIMPSQAVP
jgi:hypothetical protein